MTIDNYTVAQEGLDWASMLEDWKWALPPSFDVWIVNKFADLIIHQDDGSVWMLDTGLGSFTRIADSPDHFLELADDEDTFASWFMVDAVDDMVASGQTLGHGQCYSYRFPPGLGGDYVFSNFMVATIHVHLSMHGQVFQRTRDLPNGTSLGVKFRLE